MWRIFIIAAHKDDLSPRKLIKSHQCSTFCLLFSENFLKNVNKLSRKYISYQLVPYKQYKLLKNSLRKSHRGRSGSVSTRTQMSILASSILSSSTYLRQCHLQDHQDRR